MPNLRIELTPALNTKVPLELSKFPGIEPLWQSTVGDCNDKHNEMVSAKTKRNYCIYLPMLIFAGFAYIAVHTRIMYVMCIGLGGLMVVMIVMPILVCVANKKEFMMMTGFIDDRLDESWI